MTVAVFSFIGEAADRRRSALPTDRLHSFPCRGVVREDPMPPNISGGRCDASMSAVVAIRLAGRCGWDLVRHLDRKLLDLCDHLRTMQAEWQRLWAACPEDGHPCPAEDAHEAYAANVWPGHGDPALRLAKLPATTPDGLQAKAAAMLAIYHGVGDG